MIKKQLILELAKQAKVSGKAEEDISPQMLDFVALVVRRCADVARHDVVRKMPSEQIADMIEMHFGVG